MKSRAESMTAEQPRAADRATGPAAGPACLLCKREPVEVVDLFRPDDLRKAWAIFGVNFSPQTWQEIDARGGVELWRCASCGFQFCDPSLAGDGEFYAQLERQKKSYYPPEVPEFSRT